MLHHAVGPGEGGAEGLVAGDVGDVRVDQAPVDPGRHRGDQAGPDHGSVGFVEIGTDLAHRPVGDFVGVVLAGEAGEPAVADHGRTPLGGRQPARPEHGLLDVAAVADPLGLDTVGDQVVRQPRGQLHHRTPGQQVEHPRPRRGPAVHVEDAAATTAPAGIGEGGAEAAGVDRGRITHLHRAGQPQRREVGAGHRDADRVLVDPGSDQAGAGEGDEVAADAAPEVDDAAPGDGRGQPRGPVGGDPLPGGLLQRVGGEEEVRCGLAELGDRPHPQLDLGGGRGRLLGVGLEASYGGGHAHRVAVVVGPGVGRDVQKSPTLVGLQPGQRLDVHPSILSGLIPDPASTRSGRVLTSGLALST